MMKAGFMQKFSKLGVFVLLVLVLSGCESYYHFAVVEDAVPQNPYPFKFYPERNISVPQKISDQLLEKFPDYFTSDRNSGIPISFYADVSIFQGVNRSDNFIVHALSLGIIPAVFSSDCYGTVTAKYPECEPVSGLDSNGYIYVLKEKHLLYDGWLLSLFSYPVATWIYKAYANLTYDDGLKAFPLACLKMMQSPMTYERLLAGSKYFPHLKQQLDNLTDAEKAKLIAQQQLDRRKSGNLERKLKNQFNYELRQMEVRSQQYQAVAAALQSANTAVAAASSAAAVGHQQPAAYQASPAQKNSANTNAAKVSKVKVKVKTPVMANCYKHGPYKSYGLRCPDCFAQSNKPDF